MLQTCSDVQPKALLQRSFEFRHHCLRGVWQVTKLLAVTAHIGKGLHGPVLHHSDGNSNPPACNIHTKEDTGMPMVQKACHGNTCFRTASLLAHILPYKSCFAHISTGLSRHELCAVQLGHAWPNSSCPLKSPRRSRLPAWGLPQSRHGLCASSASSAQAHIS